MAIGVLQAGGKTVFQFGHLGGEGGVEVDAEAFGKHEKPPEALRQLAAHILVQITRMNPTHHLLSMLEGVFYFMPAIKAPAPKIKSTAARLVRDLPDSASWDDLMYQIYVRQKIESGLTDLQAGRKHSHASIRKEFAIGA